ncbi:hypothetical protein AVEN_179676-1, partial [Araneus ventricosus]
MIAIGTDALVLDIPSTFFGFNVETPRLLTDPVFQGVVHFLSQ